MRKVVLIFLSIFIAVVAAGYCMAWYSQAWQAKKSIEEEIAQINAQQKYITYDALETSGFPSEVYVSIVNPHFSGRIDIILTALQANAHPGPPAGPVIPQWDEDVKLDGRIIIGINALSDHYSLRMTGNWLRGSKIGTQAFSTGSQSSGDTACTLQMAHSGGIFGTLWNYHALVRDNANDFFRDVRLFDCSGAATVISDAGTHETLISNGPWRFYITSEPKGSQQQVRFYTKISDLEITPQGDAMMSLQRSALSPNAYTPVKYALFGKQNAEVDFSYTGPSDWSVGGNNQPLNVVLSKFDINNQMHTSSATFFLSNAPGGPNRAARITFKAEENFSEPYDIFLQNVVYNFIEQFYTGNGQQIAALQPWLQKYKADDLYGFIVPALPNLHSFGKMVQALDVGYQGSADFSTGETTLSDIEFSASPYGIKGNGRVKRTDGQMLPEGQVIWTCSNCARLVDDAAAYAMRLQKTFSYFETPEQLAAAPPLDPKRVEGLKAFLKALAAPIKDNDADKDSFVYAINSDSAMGITVNGKPMADVLTMYNQYVGPVSAPPAATPAPAR